MQPRQTFGKEERLCSKALIDDLFAHGQSFFIYPFKLIFFISETEPSALQSFPAQVLFSVPKRRFKLAVDRNKLKRLLREGYRKEKHHLYQTLNNENRQMNLAFIYTG
jgi:ribonuclease P protein component